MVRVHVEHPAPILAHDLAATWRGLLGIEPEERHGPPPWIGEGSKFRRASTGEMGDERWSDRTAPPGGSGEYRPDDAASVKSETLEGVDGAEHLCDVGAFRIELEGDVVAVADHDVSAASETMSIDLIAVAETRLRHPSTMLHLGDETSDVEQIITTEPTGVLRDDRPKEDAAETGSRVDRENQVPEGHAAGWLDRARVEDLELGQHHGQTVPVGRRPVAASAARDASDPGAADVAQVLRSGGDTRRLEVRGRERRAYIGRPLEHPTPHPEGHAERRGLRRQGRQQVE